MPHGIYPNATFLPTTNFGYPQGARDQMLPLGICDHIADGSKRTMDTPGFWEAQGTSAHFAVGADGSVSQYVNLFDIAWAQGLVSSSIDLDNPVIFEARSRGGPFFPFTGDNSGRIFAVDDHGCNVFNRAFVSIEHAGHSGEAWTPQMRAADLALKQWIIRELSDHGRAFPLDSVNRLIGHRMLDPVHRAHCPGTAWGREAIWTELTSGTIPTATVYTVQPGDTLALIAEHFGVSLEQILAANPQIFNPNLIRVGQRIVIPNQAPAPVTPAPGTGQQIYTVEEGDTLAKIARRFGVGVDEVLAANPTIVNPNLIFVGQQIVIPTAGGGGQDGGATVGCEALPDTPDLDFGFLALWPCIKAAAAQHGADAKVLAAIIQQESTFRNVRVHLDGTGHGLIGLDDNGLLPFFEQTMGFSVGRGHAARSIPPNLQIQYLAQVIASFAAEHRGNFLAAARRWHAGRGGMDGPAGQRYQTLIQSHILRLFG